MGNNKSKKERPPIPNEYPFNTMEFDVDGKINCCFFFFLTRMRPQEIINWVMLFDICFSVLLFVGYAFLVQKRWMSVGPALIFAIYGILVSVLRCKWAKWMENGTSISGRMKCYIYCRKTVLWFYLLLLVSTIGWMMMDIKRAYRNREFAPPQTHSEISRLHSTYVGTYWQEVGARSATAVYCLLTVIGIAYCLMINCAQEKAYKVLEVLRSKNGHTGQPIDIGDVCVY